jgi:hypothetical protein
MPKKKANASSRPLSKWVACCDSHEIRARRVGNHGNGFLLGVISIAQRGVQDRIEVFVPTMNRPSVPILIQEHVNNTDRLQ